MRYNKMSNRKRFENETYEEYKKSLREDAEKTKSKIRPRFIWVSSVFDKDSERMVTAQGTYVKGDE